MRCAKAKPARRAYQVGTGAAARGFKGFKGHARTGGRAIINVSHGQRAGRAHHPQDSPSSPPRVGVPYNHHIGIILLQYHHGRWQSTLIMAYAVRDNLQQGHMTRISGSIMYVTPPSRRKDWNPLSTIALHDIKQHQAKRHTYPDTVITLSHHMVRLPSILHLQHRKNDIIGRRPHNNFIYCSNRTRRHSYRINNDHRMELEPKHHITSRQSHTKLHHTGTYHDYLTRR